MPRLIPSVCWDRLQHPANKRTSGLENGEMDVERNVNISISVHAVLLLDYLDKL